jgi:hypothetical protein
MVYPALLPLMRTPRLPVVDCTDAPCRFKWTRRFRRKTKSGFCACAVTFQTQSTVAARLLRLRVRIPPRSRMSVCCECRVLLGRVACVGLGTHLDGSYRLWRV